MSRRVGQDRAAENQLAIKNLLKLEGNKVCADCKRNKHPRWASWNIGIFVCIRCSGIHRGMGTHISRVKSVDLDSWTDEQFQSVLKWGNTRANRYWEGQLAAGHVPSEAKIENFIRTKYESKRWVLAKQIPDPSTLDAEGDDTTPSGISQEKTRGERPSSMKQAAPPTQRRPPPTIDLFGDETPEPPIRPSTTDNTESRPQPRSADPTMSRPTKQGDSLLGLDFFGSTAPARPASALSNPLSSTGPSRPDLKQSILSLYSSAPKAQDPTHNKQPSQEKAAAPPTQSSDAFGDLTDAFGGLNFPSQPTAAQPAPRSAFNVSIAPAKVNITAPKPAPQISPPFPLSGGSFFDGMPSKKEEQPKAPTHQARKPSNGLNFAFAQSVPSKSQAVTSSSRDLFGDDDFSGFAAPTPVPAPTPAPAPALSKPKSVSSPSTDFSSAFNLSAQPTMTPKPTPKGPSAAPQSSGSLFDPWSSGTDNNAWAASEPAPPEYRAQAPSIDIGKPPARMTANDVSGGWGESVSTSQKPTQQPTVTADEDYGGWTSASASQTPTAAPKKSGSGFGGGSDPFDNPWG